MIYIYIYIYTRIYTNLHRYTNIQPYNYIRYVTVLLRKSHLLVLQTEVQCNMLVSIDSGHVHMSTIHKYTI